MDKWHIEDASYQRWIVDVEVPWRRTVVLPGNTAYGDESWPLISIVMPIYNTPGTFLQQALHSVLAQSYPKWQLCVADDASTDPEVRKIIERYLKRDSRIFATFREANGGIAAASNSALTLASGQYIAFMDHDDKLPEHALALVAKNLRSRPGTQLLYSDSDNINTDGQRCNPFFKPDWNYDLFLAQNYLNHLSVYSRRLIEDIGGLRETFEGSQDYDLALRAIEHLCPSQIRHIPHILYHWRVVSSAVSQSNLGPAVKAARRALGEHFERTQQAATAKAADNAILYNRVEWEIPAALPSVLLLVLSEDDEVIQASVDAEIKVIQYENIRVEKLHWGQQAKLPALGAVINTHVETADEELLCIVPAGFAPLSPDWLRRIAGQLNRHRVGAIGPKLLSSGGELLGNLLIPGLPNPLNGSPLGRAFSGAAETDKGYFGRLMLDHQVSAVHGVCLATSRADFLRVGGYNPQMSNLALLGADYCFKLTDYGLATNWLASTAIRCPDSVARTISQARPIQQELANFQQLWRQKLQYDPFYNTNFSTSSVSYHL